jgi:hypothetical protein
MRRGNRQDWLGRGHLARRRRVSAASAPTTSDQKITIICNRGVGQLVRYYAKTVKHLLCGVLVPVPNGRLKVRLPASGPRRPTALVYVGGIRGTEVGSVPDPTLGMGARWVRGAERSYGQGSGTCHPNLARDHRSRPTNGVSGRSRAPRHAISVGPGARIAAS